MAANDIHAYFCQSTQPYSDVLSCCRGMRGELIVATRQNHHMRVLLGLLNGAPIPATLEEALKGLGWESENAGDVTVWVKGEEDDLTDSMREHFAGVPDPAALRARVEARLEAQERPVEAPYSPAKSFLAQM